MSDYRAIAAVTKTLQNMLQPVVTAAVPGAVVRSVRPDRTLSTTSSGEVTVYLYQVSPNTASRNSDLVTRRGDGSLIRRPQVALDLHYLISFYGDDSRLIPQLLLGTVISALHAQPYPRAEDIPESSDSATGLNLAGTGLEDQIDRLRFIPLPLTHEELSKLWSIFFQIPYTLSIGYLCSVVLIESDMAVPQPALPIRGPRLSVGPAQPPQIESVTPQMLAAGPDAVIRLQGRNLSVAGTSIRIGGLSVSPRPVAPGVVEVSVPPGVPPGVQTAQAVTAGGMESNRAAFVLQPTILSAWAEAGSVSVSLSPLPRAGQKIALLLSEAPPGGSPPRSYTFGPVTADGRDATVRIKTPGAAPGTYLARAQVDGIASPLTVDTDSGSPTFDMYTGPRVEIT
jgi:hypothetical protein